MDKPKKKTIIKRPPTRFIRKRSKIQKLSHQVSSFLQRSSRSLKIASEQISTPPVVKVAVKRNISREYSKQTIVLEEEVEAGVLDHLVN